MQLPTYEISNAIFRVQKITCEKSHMNFHTCEIPQFITMSHVDIQIWNFTCEMSRAKTCHMWNSTYEILEAIFRVQKISGEELHMNFHTCEIPQFIIWKSTSEISNATFNVLKQFHMWNFPCEKRHMGNTCFLRFTCVIGASQTQVRLDLCRYTKPTSLASREAKNRVQDLRARLQV